ncbi:hypothetical protein ACVIHA_002791 [Bradyrhizobium liaoningense]
MKLTHANDATGGRLQIGIPGRLRIGMHGRLRWNPQHLQSTVLTLLDRNTSQREIHRLTGVDRKTIRRYQALRAGAEANSPGEVTTGSVSADGQIPPPRPPAFGTSEATVTSSLARSACEAHRTWIEEQVRLKRNAQGDLPGPG